MHPDGITCQTAEDAMDEGEQWDGNTKGTKLRINLTGGTATVSMVDEDGKSVSPESDSSSVEDDVEPMSSQPQSHTGSMPSNEGEDNEDSDDESDEGGGDAVDETDLFGDDDEGFEFHEGSVEGESGD